MMADPVLEAELLRLNQRLLDSIVRADWQTYQELCSPNLTAFEPEAMGHLVKGLDFHRFYFELGGVKENQCTTMASPHVWIKGDVAVIAYVRLNQRMDPLGMPTISCVMETRVWERCDGRWKHVHFHRSS